MIVWIRNDNTKEHDLPVSWRSCAFVSVTKCFRDWTLCFRKRYSPRPPLADVVQLYFVVTLQLWVVVYQTEYLYLIILQQSISYTLLYRIQTLIVRPLFHHYHNSFRYRRQLSLFSLFIYCLLLVFHLRFCKSYDM